MFQPAERWIRAYVDPVGEIAVVHERPWATVLRVPLAVGVAWFKECNEVQWFEPRLTAGLSARWPDRVSAVIAVDEERHWLLLGDAGETFAQLGSSPELWLELLPSYAELQRGEVAYADEHLRHGVPDLRLERLPGRLEELLGQELPLDTAELDLFRGSADSFGELCAELDAHGVPPSVQHDDLHQWNAYVDGSGGFRILDWGDACVSHPYASLVVTFSFLEQGGLRRGDPWFARLRDAYLEPWGEADVETFELALRVGSVAHAIAWFRQRDHLPATLRAEFDERYAIVLRRALRALSLC